MKTNFKYASVALIALGAILTSCEKSELLPVTQESIETKAVNEQDRAAARNYKMIGDWKLVRYSEGSVDLTSQFEGFTFSFKENGILIAFRGNERVSGLWSRGYNNSNNTRRKLYMDLGTRMPFSDLTDTWHIVEMSTNRVQLRRVFDSQDDYITFVR
ncbi:MAG: hypothetical protein M3R27_07835 [Bacteroidota bacterium]|nr:hypothetical protein [Bacteroidota bacterium]